MSKKIVRFMSTMSADEKKKFLEMTFTQQCVFVDKKMKENGRRG